MVCFELESTLVPVAAAIPGYDIWHCAPCLIYITQPASIIPFSGLSPAGGRPHGVLRLGGENERVAVPQRPRSQIADHVLELVAAQHRNVAAVLRGVLAHMRVQLVHARVVVEVHAARRPLGVPLGQGARHVRPHLLQHRHVRAPQIPDSLEVVVAEHYEVPHVVAGVLVETQQPAPPVQDDRLVGGVGAGKDQLVDPLAVVALTRLRDKGLVRVRIVSMRAAYHPVPLHRGPGQTSYMSRESLLS